VEGVVGAEAGGAEEPSEPVEAGALTFGEFRPELLNLAINSVRNSSSRFATIPCDLCEVEFDPVFFSGELEVLVAFVDDGNVLIVDLLDFPFFALEVFDDVRLGTQEPLTGHLSDLEVGGPELMLGLPRQALWDT
jgi:hypothetical protein